MTIADDKTFKNNKALGRKSMAEIAKIIFPHGDDWMSKINLLRRGNVKAI